MSYITYTASAAPSSPASGKVTLWMNSTNNRPTAIDSSGIMYGNVYAATTSASSAITNTETIIAGGNAVNGATLKLPPNFLQAGSYVRCTAFGTCTSSVANTCTWRIRCGTAGTTSDAIVASTTSTAAASGTTISFKAVMDLVVRTAGASGTCQGGLAITNAGTTGLLQQVAFAALPANANIDTTGTNYIEMTWVSAAATTSITVAGGIVEVYR